jgi:hypothetical protein
MNRTFHPLTIQNDSPELDHIKDNTNIVLVVLNIWIAACVFFLWRKLRSQKHSIIISIFFLLFLCLCIMQYRINRKFW